MSEIDRRPSRHRALPPTSGTRAAAAGLEHARRARLPLEPARGRPRARQPGRRQHVGKGHRRRPRGPRDARPLGQGLGHRPGDDHAARASRLSAWTRSLPLRRPRAMDDAAMVDYLRRCALGPDQPRPSIETLLHAFVAATHVDHTHPDAVIALTSSPERAPRSPSEAFGDEAVWLDYQRPGFAMSKRSRTCSARNPSARAVLLERHGLVTWGETGEEATEHDRVRHAELPRRSTGSAPGQFGLGGQVSAELGDDECTLPPGADPARTPRRTPRRCRRRRARGRPQPGSRRICLVGTRARGESGRRAVPRPPHEHEAQATRRSPSTRRATAPRACGRLCGTGSTGTAAWYRDYSRAHLDDETRPFPIDPAGPRVMLIPGVGIVTSGADAAGRELTRDLYHRAIAVQDAADALGGFRSLSEAEAFAIEYWPLERYKLAQAAQRGPLSRTDCGDHRWRERHRPGHGAAARRSRRPRRRRRPERRRSARGRDEIVATHGTRRALAVEVDVTSEAPVARDVPTQPCSSTAGSTSSSRRPDLRRVHR